MDDKCLLALYGVLISEAKTAFDTLAVIEMGTMEKIMIEAQLRTRQVRKGVWGLASTGLIIHKPGRPVRLSDNGERLVDLLKAKEQ